MKCEVVSMKVAKFVPKQIAITLDTLEEAQAFMHLIGCWETQTGCSEVHKVREIAMKLRMATSGICVNERRSSNQG